MRAWTRGLGIILIPASFIRSSIHRPRLMKIGLFGGTFDPIHWGHLRSAEEVSETFGLDRVYFVPAAVPPHKRGQTTTPARDRLQMVRLAVAKNPKFSVSTAEISRPGVSYSIDTIREFAATCDEERFALFHHRPGCLSRDRHLEGFCRDISAL